LASELFTDGFSQDRVPGTPKFPVDTLHIGWVWWELVLWGGTSWFPCIPRSFVL